jgi:hypothetical protein
MQTAKIQMLDGTSAQVSDSELPQFLQDNWEKIDKKSGMRSRSPEALTIEAIQIESLPDSVLEQPLHR